MNKWLTEKMEEKDKRISNLEDTISQFIYVKKKHILRTGISIQKKTINLNINLPPKDIIEKQVEPEKPKV